MIDAGAGDNMLRFLRWRFRRFAKRLDFEAAILSHSDLDHYGGFEGLFDEPNLFFRNVYTNGFMERKVESDTDILGPRVSHNGAKFITSLVPDLDSLDEFLSTSTNFKGKKYPTMLKGARDAGKFTNFKMLSVKDGFVPGFAPGENEVELELLGPVPEDVDGKMHALVRRHRQNPGRPLHRRAWRYRGITIFAGATSISPRRGCC